MNAGKQYEILQWRSTDDEPHFFAYMGRFFASASVRRSCGGYPLNDGPRYLWFILRKKSDPKILGFISVEHQGNIVRIREGYVRPEARGLGFFRLLRNYLIDYLDKLQLTSIARVQSSCAPLLVRYGFQVQSSRGRWVLLKRIRYVTSKENN